MKLAILGCKGTTLDLLHALVGSQVSIDSVFSLPEELGRRHGVAFYQGGKIREFCRTSSIPCFNVTRYDMRCEEDVRLFQRDLDVLAVIGWERLIPDAVLNSLRVCACGMHGSAMGLPKGRGRSPLNWSLIQGKDRFITSLFKYMPGTDDGPIIGSKMFEINPHDTIETLHHKNRVAMVQLLRDCLVSLENGTLALTPQPTVEPSYYPKRTPDDGGIDWSRKTAEIYDFVRALTRPYPGAFTFLHGKKIHVWRVSPFDANLFSGSAAGTIVDISVASGKFVVRTGDGSLLVDEFSGAPLEGVRVGDVLDSCDYDRNLAEIRQRYPASVPPEQREI